MSLDLKALELPVARILKAPGIDLSTISAKRVRKTLLEDPQYAHLRLTHELLKTRRTDVDQVIAQIFDQVNRAAKSARPKRKRAKAEEREEEAEEEVADDDDEGEEEKPPSDDDGDGEGEPAKPSRKKKAKNARSVEESDAALARKLSSEINSRSRRGASTAAGAAASSPRKAKRKTKKSAETVESEDEDEGEGEAKPKKRGAKGGFAKEYLLSVPLASVLTVDKLSRPQVVKRLWEYIREHELQNPSNKKEIICDDALRAVFAVDKIDMFRMNKVLGQHLHEGE